MEIWHEKRASLLVRASACASVVERRAVRRLAAKAEDGDIKAFEIFEKAASDSGGTRQAGSQFNEPADALTMANIIGRIRNMPAEQPTPQSELEQGAGGGENLSRAAEERNGDLPADDQKDLP